MSSVLGLFDWKARKKIKLTPIMKLRNAARKVKSIVSLSLNSRARPKKTYRNNPLLFQYYYLLVYWVILNFSVFFWHSYQHNPKKLYESGLNVFVCQKDEQELKLSEGKKNCKSYLQNSYSQVFYGLNILYLLFAIAQIRAGKSVSCTVIEPLEKLFYKAKYYITRNIPLLRETMIVIEYCAKKTSLNFTDFLLVVDITEFMHRAKLNHILDLKHPTGKAVSRILRLLIMVSVGLGLIIALVLPLFLFSEGNNKEAYDIVRGSIELQLLDKREQKITSLFQTDKMIENKNLTWYPDSEQRLKKLYTERSLKRYYRQSFKVVKFRRFSDTYLQMTPKLLEELKYYIMQQELVKIRFRMRLYVIL